MCFDVFDVVLLLGFKSVDFFGDLMLMMCESIIDHIFDGRSGYSTDVFGKRIAQVCFVGMCCFVAVVTVVAGVAVMGVGVVVVVLEGNNL